ncbi:dihydrofolate reductase family protein [Pokkaliibacter sp. CJK22405]|uniref:dihydrofolate reductase family protein n=1 Tax=Pokkaliibacter sp. CJK22405 TaxID=3384615 RepID=UPI0039851757
MRPYIICHMITSLDGSILPDQWHSTAEVSVDAMIERHYDHCADSFKAQGWIVGRETMSHYVPGVADESVSDEKGFIAAQWREDNLKPANGKPLAIAFDPKGRLRPETAELDGEHLVLVLGAQAPTYAIEHLQRAGVSYLFAGQQGDDVLQALEKISAFYGVERLLLQGGAITNGHFLRAGAIDEISTLVCPALDGATTFKGIFQSTDSESQTTVAAPLNTHFLGYSILEDGVIWSKYRLTAAR